VDTRFTRAKEYCVRMSSRKTIVLIGVFAIISLLFGAIIPGGLAIQQGVLDASGVKSRLPDEIKRILADADASRGDHLRAIAAIDSRLAAMPKPADDIDELLRLRAFHAERLAERPAISVSGYFDSFIFVVWILWCFFLLVLLFVLKPTRKALPSTAKGWLDLGGGALLLHLIYHWTVWARNFLLDGSGRRYFSQAHYDISPIGFFVQEVQNLVVSVMVVAIWMQWMQYARTERRRWRQPRTCSGVSGLSPTLVSRLSMMLLHWQLASLILAGAFLPVMCFFWSMIFTNRDYRYLIAAITLQAIWAVSWTIITQPLLRSWMSWLELRNRALFSSITQDEPLQTDDLLKCYGELRPFSFWNLGLSTAIAVITYISPLLSQVFR
jgi:hypothetical protein